MVCKKMRGGRKKRKKEGREEGRVKFSMEENEGEGKGRSERRRGEEDKV